MKKTLLAILLAAASCAVAWAQGPVPPITSGYGARGEFAVTAEKFSSPLYDRENVYVFRPAGLTAPAPVVFFAPGYNNNDPKEYEALINHIVSRGYALIYAPFQLLSSDISLHERRYDTIWAGFDEAVKRYGESFDFNRVGYVGHSYGAAATLAMMARGLERGWGKDGLFIFAAAPWYYFQFSLKQFVNFPPHAKVIIQVYEEDNICDHRVGKEMFDRINLPASEKEFVIVRSEERLGYKLYAEHSTPSSSSGENALDYYGVYRLFDALADYAWTGNEAGRRIALGNGSDEQKFMGRWPDGQPVRALLAGDCLSITRSSLSFLFPFVANTINVTNASSASFNAANGLAPDSLAVAWGTNLSLYPLPATGEPPLFLNGTAVKIKDSQCVERLAPLFFVAPTQVNYLVPAGTALGAATVTVFNEAGAVSVGTVQINQVAPSLFSANSDGRGTAAASVLRVRSDGTQSYEQGVQFDVGQNRYVPLPIDLSVADDQVFLLLFGTGLRYRTALNQISVTIGGVPVEVLYAGAQGLLGLDQINLRLTRNLVNRGEVDVVLTVEGKRANVVRVSFK
jgi:uncharacterized protein (TIGR03437 family)